ncbi:MAG: protein kinase, partial [Eubacterium sp.]|nr:protein kinase [Eubacterium sp.]
MKKRCYGCMSLMEKEDRFCSICGFHNESYLTKKPKNALMPGTLLKDRYLIGKVLGAGGFGITYLGYDKILAVKVAIKEFLPSQIATRSDSSEDRNNITVYEKSYITSYYSGLDKFLSEARILAQLNQEPGVVSVQNFFYENNSGYIIMEYLPGPNLKEMIKQLDHGMYEEEIINRLLPLMTVLGKIHQMGVIHRDISPDNIVLNDKGELTLIDFGAAKVLDLNKKTTTLVVKNGFAPPEQYGIGIPQGPWTDIYALCSTIYYLVTRRIPDNSFSRMANDNLVSLSNAGMPVSKQFSAVVKKGMSIQITDRYQTVDELKAALLSCLKMKYPSSEEHTYATKPLHGTSDSESAWVSSSGNWKMESGDHGGKQGNKKQVSGVLLGIIMVLGGALLILAGVGLARYLDRENKENVSVDNTVETVESTTSTTAVPATTTQPETPPTEEVKKVVVPYPADAEVFKGHHYLLVNESMDWNKARKKCAAKKGHLATVTSQEEQEFIRGMIERNGEKYHYWLGGTDSGSEG